MKATVIRGGLYVIGGRTKAENRQCRVPDQPGKWDAAALSVYTLELEQDEKAGNNIRFHQSLGETYAGTAAGFSCHTFLQG